MVSSGFFAFHIFAILIFVTCAYSIPTLLLYGAGSTAIEPLQNQLAVPFQSSNPSSSVIYRILYNATGSGEGKQAIIHEEVDFVWSESSLDANEQAAANTSTPSSMLLQLPIYAVGVAIVYNIPGLDVDSSHALNLTMQILIDIYKGQILRWNEPRILSINHYLYNQYISDIASN